MEREQKTADKGRLLFFGQEGWQKMCRQGARHLPYHGAQPEKSLMLFSAQNFLLLGLKLRVGQHASFVKFTQSA